MLQLLVILGLWTLGLSAPTSTNVSFGEKFFDQINRIRQSKIVGGEEAVPHSHPHQVSLQIKTLLTSTHMCGGSIIDENHVICAAHCVKGQIPAVLRIVAGAHNIKDRTEDWQIRKVVDYVFHESYDSSTIQHDISILKVDAPFEFNDRVAPIALPQQGFDPPGGTVCKNTGWGKFNNLPIGNTPNKLQVVDIPIVERNTCIGWYENVNPVFDTEVCAGTEEGGISPCNGDSGGPLVCPNADGAQVLSGIVSWGMVPCGQPAYPGVYTNVGSYIDWIEQHRTNYL